MLDGFKSEWHSYSVPGQQAEFAAENKPEMEAGWHLVPGRVEKPVWGLLAMFAAIFVFLAWFETLGR
jgi:SSS family solute:Na+ symporter